MLFHINFCKNSRCLLYILITWTISVISIKFSGHPRVTFANAGSLLKFWVSYIARFIVYIRSISRIFPGYSWSIKNYKICLENHRKRRCPVSPRIISLTFLFCSVSGANLAYVLLTWYVKMWHLILYQSLLGLSTNREVNKHHNSHCLKTSNSDNPRLLGFWINIDLFRCFSRLDRNSRVVYGAYSFRFSYLTFRL